MGRGSCVLAAQGGVGVRRTMPQHVDDGKGRVGPIDGINFKLKGAQRAGADVILIPQDNLEDVDWSPQGVKVIPVSSFNDALHVLQK